jgi:hypothetical protein
MQISTYQRVTLERLREMRRVGGPTWSKHIRFYRNQWIGGVLSISAMSWLAPDFWLMFVGLGLGGWARDVSSIRSFRSQWPVMNEVIDWERVDRLVASPPAPTSDRPAAQV